MDSTIYIFYFTGTCPPGWRINHGSCYEYHVHHKLSWNDSREFCENRGAKLLTIMQ